MMLLAALVVGLQPDGPVEFGIRELRAALADAGLASTRVSVPRWQSAESEGESYSVRFGKGSVQVVAWDDVGRMYGLLEAAERIRNGGAQAWRQPVVRGKPYFQDRGWNIFLPLPWDYDKNFVDNDPAALTDPKRWFFMDDRYWRTLFDQMARSRFNWLDVHGPYDLDTTRFPNLYAYFIQSDKFPKVGVAPEIKAKLLKQLNRVIALAHSRGIRVSLMSYEARFDIPHNPRPGYEGTESEVYDYTKEVVEKLIRQCPKLDKIGYRIGESGRGAEFFRCYGEAIRASGRDIPVYTRSWVTTKARVVPLARTSSDFTVEIKYNGEHWGAPYIMQGGRVAGWYSYFWEDYLSYSGPEGTKLWPGIATPGGPTGDTLGSGSAPRNSTAVTRWPSQPYKIVWQVRANGTHRIFPFFQPHWTRSSILSMKVGTMSGYTVESMGSYFPQKPAYYLADPSKVGYDWTFQRDEMYMACWGRLGYDPNVPDWRFDAMLARRFGKEAGLRLAYAWKAASKVVPIAFMAYSLGPDHRNHAPELEWGGNTEAYLQGEPFDSHVFMNAREALAYKATGGRDGRLTPAEAAAALDSAARLFGTFGARSAQGMDELQAAIRQLHALAAYYAARFRCAQALAEFESGSLRVEDELLLDAVPAFASNAWSTLATSHEAAFYGAFTDRLRMRAHDFHWKRELPKVEADALDLAALLPKASAPIVSRAAPSVRRPSWNLDLGLSFDARTVRCQLPTRGLIQAWLLEKPVPSSTFFHKTPMRRVGDRFVAEFEREPWGHCVAAEIEMEGGTIHRIPWWEDGTPYLVVPTMQRPTPNIYSAEEAMRYLKPEILDPEKYGWLVVAQRGWMFHTRFDTPTKRKLLQAVERGMNLLVMQQDYTSGRYPLDWLPIKPKLLNRNEGVFDPGGALGMERVESKDVLWQVFEGPPASDRSDRSDTSDQGWQVFGNGGVARLQHGKGAIWMVQARFSQRLHVPGVARNFLALLQNAAPLAHQASRKSARRPAILVDAGTEGATYVTSVVPDFMNAHDLPFLTLGEVIAKEQGMDSMTPVPGPVSDDSVLGGRGPEIMRSYLEAKVKRAAARPLPKTREEMEARKPADRKEFMRMMGLDPLPPRTPLNARVTGVIPCAGYRIEKLVFESRPGFIVTAHLYVPQGARGLPVILNVHGHWPVKKQSEVVQSRAIFQALRGYVAIVIDSPGHSFESADAPIERRWQGNHNDWFLLLGSANTTALYAWDVMRALDYLETRPECDTSRVGITGASGGGLATLYTFVADERIKCAIPVVYATSLEVNPHNGCLCNHVPATLQVGDRSDLLALRAPNPVLVIGAEVDPEFPPEGTKKTGEKLRAIWKLYGKEEDAQWKVFSGGHDYSKPMRELAMGFFDQHLKGIGDGSPVPEPAFTPIRNSDPELLVMPEFSRQGAKAPGPTGARTQRDIALERIRAAKPRSWQEIVKLNGGMAQPCDLQWKHIPADQTAMPSLPLLVKYHFTFQSEPGLTIPGVGWGLLDAGSPTAVILISESGKAAAFREFDVPKLYGHYVCVGLDARGFGEMLGLDPRLMAYLGSADAFDMGWDVAQAARYSLQVFQQVVVVGRGPTASQAAMFAALFEPRISAVIGLQGLKEWEDAFKEGVPSHCIMPRADLAGPLSHIRSLVKCPALWTFRGEKEPNLVEAIGKLIGTKAPSRLAR